MIEALIIIYRFQWMYASCTYMYIFICRHIPLCVCSLQKCQLYNITFNKIAFSLTLTVTSLCKHILGFLLSSVSCICRIKVNDVDYKTELYTIHCSYKLLPGFKYMCTTCINRETFLAAVSKQIIEVYARYRFLRLLLSTLCCKWQQLGQFIMQGQLGCVCVRGECCVSILLRQLSDCRFLCKFFFCYILK